MAVGWRVGSDDLEWPWKAKCQGGVG